MVPLLYNCPPSLQLTQPRLSTCISSLLVLLLSVWQVEACLGEAKSKKKYTLFMGGRDDNDNDIAVDGWQNY